jgi:type IV pilus assembly protein PilV
MPKTHAQQRGFSLVELLIALLIFSIGILSIAGLQTISKQSGFEAIQRTTAAQIAQGLLEEMRLNGDAIAIYLAAGAVGQGSRGAEPAPKCVPGAECNSAQKAVHDLWFWEQILDGNLETTAGTGTGGLVLPTLCITGAANGVAGIYQVSVVWHGMASISNGVNNGCGAASGDYGAANEFRRIVQVPTYIDPAG